MKDRHDYFTGEGKLWFDNQNHIASACACSLTVAKAFIKKLREHGYPQLWDQTSRLLLESANFSVRAWTYPSGVKALSLENSRGKLVILPWQGQMIWSAEFDGVDLTMLNMFTQPRPSASVIGTYGCFMFHSGLLRNGCGCLQCPKHRYRISQRKHQTRDGSAALYLGQGQPLYIQLDIA
ncbi:hypothetical protein GSU75_02068 [Pseudomonas savastanoi pv. phaseolicola]|nr:hypothetical protein [Pseudomonas savastanoi pv. phaseolicola]